MYIEQEVVCDKSGGLIKIPMEHEGLMFYHAGYKGKLTLLRKQQLLSLSFKLEWHILTMLNETLISVPRLCTKSLMKQ